MKTWMALIAEEEVEVEVEVEEAWKITTGITSEVAVCPVSSDIILHVIL